MCGFFTGISAPNSISLAYVLIRYANDPITPTNTPMVNIQRGGTAVISSTNQNCHSSFNATANIAAAKPIIATFRPVLILLLGPFIIGTRLLYSPIKPHPKGNTINTDRKSTRLNSSHVEISYAVFCLKKKKKKTTEQSSSDVNNTTHLD